METGTCGPDVHCVAGPWSSWPPAFAQAYNASPEQSKPLVPAPYETPYLGPLTVPPPHEYGVPSHFRAARAATAPRPEAARRARLTPRPVLRCAARSRTSFAT